LPVDHRSEKDDVMNARTLLLLLVLGLTAAFVALNWGAFTMPTALSIGVATVEAPLGLIMLGFLAALSLLFIGWVIYLQSTVLIESRRQAKELQTQRELADKAEASRFTELRSFLADELGRSNQAVAESGTALLARIDDLEKRSRAALDETTNSLSAYIGELEDRLERRSMLPPDVPIAPGRLR
jgi:hypothetical protein